MKSSNNVLNLENNIANVLKKDFNITDDEEMDKIVTKVLKKIKL